MASSHENNEGFLDEEIEGESDAEVPAQSGVGKKRKTCTKKTSLDLPPKPRKKIVERSTMWKHFTRNPNDRSTCKCQYCGMEIGCDSKTVETSPMRNHIERCKFYKAYQESGEQKVLTGDSCGNLTSIKYDPSVFRRSINEMIVLNELPFSFVESEGFRRFCHNVIPCYNVVSRRTCTRDIAAMFVQEKAVLKKLFSGFKQRVSFTTDIWVAPTTSYSYMVVTAHWIDVNWILQKRIISFRPVTDHKGDTIAKNLMECCDEWGIEQVFTVTVDNAKGNDRALTIFKDAMRLKQHNALMRDGDYLHMRCCAHILNLVVKDGLEHANDSIVAIRNAVKYVRSSFTRLKSFELRVETGKVSRGSLSLDCATRWNSTYLMLTAALKLRVAFEKMLEEDKVYNEYFLEIENETGKKRVGPPVSASWDEVERLVKFLRIFFNATLAFSATKTVTSSICYNEIVTIEQNLITLSNNVDEKVRIVARSMRNKFEKYWDGLINMNPLVIIASIFDPRKKMQFVSLCFSKLYGKDSLESNHLRESIKKVMGQLYEEYAILLTKPVQNDKAAARSDNVDSEQPRVVFDIVDEYERMDSCFAEMVSESANEKPNAETFVGSSAET